MILRDWLKNFLAGLAGGGRGDDPRADSGGEGRPAREDFGDYADPADPFDPFPEPVRLEIEDTFDLHAIAPRDVARAVEAYLVEAHGAGFRSVRIIHGKGRFVQRAAVRKILERTPFVAAFTDAPPQAGGLGATVAHFTTGETKTREGVVGGG